MVRSSSRDSPGPSQLALSVCFTLDSVALFTAIGPGAAHSFFQNGIGEAPRITCSWQYLLLSGGHSPIAPPAGTGEKVLLVPAGIGTPFAPASSSFSWWRIGERGSSVRGRCCIERGFGVFGSCCGLYPHVVSAVLSVVTGSFGVVSLNVDVVPLAVSSLAANSGGTPVSLWRQLCGCSTNPSF